MSVTERSCEVPHWIELPQSKHIFFLAEHLFKLLCPTAIYTHVETQAALNGSS